MKLDARRPVVVLLGAWNPVIIQPGWVAQYVFDIAPGTTLKARGFQNVIDQRQCFYINDIPVGLSCDPTRVEFYLNRYDEQSLTLLGTSVRRLLDTLQHTPYGDFGINFFFTEDEPENEAVDKVSTNDDINQNFNVIQQELTARIQYDANTILTLVRMNSQTGLGFDFNYNRIVTTRADFEPLSNGLVGTLLAASKNTLRELYGVHGDETISHEFSEG